MASAHVSVGRPAAGRAGWSERLMLAALMAATLWFYGYLANSRVADPWAFHAGAVDYYHLQSEGFLAGQLAMTVTPDPELATLPDPYDPPARLRIGHPGLADASYYGGKYYLYFGAAPILALFLPFKLLTGVQISESWACTLFCGGGLLACLAIFLDLRRRFFPGASPGVACLGALLLGAGNLCAMMLTRSQFYEVPIAAAYCFSSLAMLALTMAFAAGDRPRRTWLGAASVAFGLAVASRPHFLLASPVLLLVWLWLRKDRISEAAAGRSGSWGEAAALVLPVGVVVASLLVYNQLRFGAPLEFGQRYQLGGSNVGKMTLLTWRSIPINVYYYFWAPAQWTRYFPFVDPVKPYPGTTSGFYYGVEDPFGLLANLPCFWLVAAVAPLWWWRWRNARGLGRRLVLFLGFFAPVCLFILVFVSATNRYMVDFLPSLLLVAMVGLLMIGDLPLRRGPARMLRGAALGAMTAASLFFSVMAAFQHNGLFQHHQPEAFDRIGRWFNLPTAGWERLAGQRYGPVQATVQLSRASVGANEPLLVSGSGTRSDFIYIYYTGPESIQIGATHAGDAENFLSRPIPLDYGVPHTFGIEAGSLYPPASHPFFRGFSPGEIRERKNRLRVTIDGIPYIDLQRKFYDASPALVSVGRNHVSDYAGRALKGAVLSVRRAALPAPISPFAGGSAVEIAFLPGASATARREPLVATGEPGNGDLIFAAYDDASHLRLGFHHAGSEPILSDPLEFDPAQIQRLQVSLGSFYPSPRDPNERELARALYVTWNDRLIWLEPAVFSPGGKPPMLGASAWNSDQVTGAFSGRLVAVQARPPPALRVAEEPFAFHRYWLRSDGPGYGPLRLQVDFPRGQAGKFEPLLVTGASVSQADYLWIQYVDAARATIGYEHTGGGGPRALIPLAMSEPHVLEIDLPALYPPAGDAFFRGCSPMEVAALKNHARIAVDGVVRLEARVKAFESTPAQATPGENRLSDTFGRRFSGTIRARERGAFAPPRGFLTETGPLELVLDAPAKRAAGRSELLLASGGEMGVDTLSLVYGDGDEVFLEIREHSGARHRSAALPFAPAGGQILRVAWGGFTAPGRPPATMARVSCNGQVVLEAELDFARATPQGIWLGGGLPAAEGFSGLIRSVRRLAEDRR